MRRSSDRRATMALGLAFVLFAAACSGRSADGGATPSGGQTTELATTTTAGTQPVDKIVWGVYRETNSLDPIYAFDYPENTVLSMLCESLLRQEPDGSIVSGLADLTYPDDTTLVFTLKPGITFWDGKPLTPEDVVYSLERQSDVSLGGFYGATFTLVKSIEATGSNEVTIKLKAPDYWLANELASAPGWIVEKAYVEEQGKAFGTPSGGTMCTGSYKLDSWKTGNVLSVVRNDTYWQPDVKPLVTQIDFKGTPDEAALTSALETGDVNGYYAGGLTTLDQLKASGNVSVTNGSGWNTDAFIISSFDGVLGDVKVRQALSMAIDRQGIIDTVYKGAALLPKSLSPPGTWGYGREVFQQAYDALPELGGSIAEAKQMVEDAGATGGVVTLGMSSELNNVAVEAGALQSAGQSIGLDVKLKSVSAANYINFFIDPKAREGIDGFFTTNYGDYADPAALLSTLVLPEGSQNFAGYDNPQVTKLMREARATADLDARAQKVADAQALIMQDQPWISVTFPYSVLITSSDLSGAVASFAYMFAPWGNDLGGTG